MSDNLPQGPNRGGRPKGSPNRRTQELVELADELGVNPIEILLLIAKGDWEALGYTSPTTHKVTQNGDIVEVDRIPLEERSKAAAACAPYLYAKRTAISIKDEREKNTGPALVINYSGRKAPQLEEPKE